MCHTEGALGQVHTPAFDKYVGNVLRSEALVQKNWSLSGGGDCGCQGESEKQVEGERWKRRRGRRLISSSFTFQVCLVVACFWQPGISVGTCARMAASAAPGYETTGSIASGHATAAVKCSRGSGQGLTNFSFSFEKSLRSVCSFASDGAGSAVHLVSRGLRAANDLMLSRPRVPLCGSGVRPPEHSELDTILQTDASTSF